MPELIDSHPHLWDRDRFTYPWMAGLPDLPHTSRPGELETAATGAIGIEAGAARDEAFAEVEWLTRIAAGSPLIRGIVAAVDCTDPGLAEAVDRLRSHPLVVGVRDNFEGRATGDLAVGASETADTLLAGTLTALDAGLSIDLCVRAEQLSELETFVSAIVSARGSADRVVIDHLGKPLPADRAFAHDGWAAAMASLALHTGLHVKFSGLPGQVPGRVSDEAANALAARYAADTLAAFGPARTMYGSDHPVSTTGHGLGLPVWEEAATSALRTVLDEADLAAVLGGTAADFYLSRRSE